MVSQRVARLGVGPVMAAFLLNSVKALVRHMGTFHVLGVSPQHSFSLCRISGPSSVWVHASMELKSGAVFHHSLLAALWVGLHEDLSDCRASRGRCIKFVGHSNVCHSSMQFSRVGKLDRNISNWKTLMHFPGSSAGHWKISEEPRYMIIVSLVSPSEHKNYCQCSYSKGMLGSIVGTTFLNIVLTISL